MYIEFKTNGYKMAQFFQMQMIEESLDEWTARHKIKTYKLTAQRNSIRLTFEHDRDYSLFAMSWRDDYGVLGEYLIKD